MRQISPVLLVVVEGVGCVAVFDGWPSEESSRTSLSRSMKAERRTGLHMRSVSKVGSRQFAAEVVVVVRVVVWVIWVLDGRAFELK